MYMRTFRISLQTVAVLFIENCQTSINEDQMYLSLPLARGESGKIDAAGLGFA